MSIRALGWAVLVTVALLAAPALGATLRVGKRKPFKTIEAAVAAASDGDRILVDRGVYDENVAFNTTIDRLQIIGRGATWDGGSDASQPCLDARGDRIMIRGFTFRHGGDGVRILGDDALVKACAFRGQGLDGVDISGDGARVVNCRFRGSLDRAIEIDGDGAIVASNTVANCSGNLFQNDEFGGGVIEVAGTGALLQRNSIRNTSGNAMRLRGSGSRLRKAGDGGRVLNNRVFNCGGDGLRSGTNPDPDDEDFDDLVHEVLIAGNNFANCDNDFIDVNGDGCVVQNNFGRLGGDHGVSAWGNGTIVKNNRLQLLTANDVIQYVGDDAQIVGNTISDYRADAITVDGARPTIQRNRIFRNMGGTGDEFEGKGIEVFDQDRPDGLSVGGLIESNAVLDCIDDAMHLRVDDTTVRRNTLRVIGTNCFDAGIEIIGSDNEISRNTVFDSAGWGIRVRGDRNLVTRGNYAECLNDGVFIASGDDNEVTRNSARNCDGEGLANAGDNTTASGNTLKNNRIDLANDGSFANDADAQNDFDTGGSTTASEILCELDG